MLSVSTSWGCSRPSSLNAQACLLQPCHFRRLQHSTRLTPVCLCATCAGCLSARVPEQQRPGVPWRRAGLRRSTAVRTASAIRRSSAAVWRRASDAVRATSGAAGHAAGFLRRSAVRRRTHAAAGLLRRAAAAQAAAHWRHGRRHGDDDGARRRVGGRHAVGRLVRLRQSHRRVGRKVVCLQNVLIA